MDECCVEVDECGCACCVEMDECACTCCVEIAKCCSICGDERDIRSIVLYFIYVRTYVYNIQNTIYISAPRVYVRTYVNAWG